MQHIISTIAQHGLLLVFLTVLLAEGGLPLPAFPILMTAAAFVTPDRYQVPEIILAGASGCLMADLAWYWCGQRYGQRVLGLLCRISLSPDVCVRQTETVFEKVGLWSLVFAKFLPGFATVSTAMAGVIKIPMLVFILVDAIGSLLFVAIPVALGRLFRDAIADVLSTLAHVGKLGGLVVLAALGLYLLARWWRRQAFIRQLRMDRITVSELRRLIEAHHDLLVLDVRTPQARVQGMIPGAVPAHLADMDSVMTMYPREREIVVYCSCPNEASAAIAARHLKKAGFKRIRPLLGGIDAWVEAGLPVTPSTEACSPG